MNWKLIFKLSLLGLAMAILTVYFIPSNIEPVFWLIIFIVCAYLIAKNSSGKYFQHGFMVSLFNCVWVTTFHILLFNTYIENHQQEVQMMSEMPMSAHPRLMMLITGPVVGIISGLVLGLFSFIASKLIKKI
jgi:uncharacterized membrane protein (UPF0136 family)